jgi:hypothetical protein
MTDMIAEQHYANLHYSSPEVAAFRDEMKLYGEIVTNMAAWQVLKHVGDKGVAIDALLMARRPLWLESLAGKHVRTGGRA